MNDERGSTRIKIKSRETQLRLRLYFEKTAAIAPFFVKFSN